MKLSWTKKLTDSDAQQDTNGAKMRFLRFTKGNISGDHKTWFRNEFFASAPWQPGTSRAGRPIEIATIDVNVIIKGENLGVQAMKLDHDHARGDNHNAPTTHLHYNEETWTTLESLKLTGDTVTVEVDNQSYQLVIG